MMMMGMGDEPPALSSPENVNEDPAFVAAKAA
jgi:hypothetical protein